MLFIHGIHTSSLRLRQPALHQVIQTMRLAAQKAGFEVVPRLVLTPNPADIQASLKEYEARIDYAKVPGLHADLDAHIHTLNLQEISNLEKHRKAWTFATKAPKGAVHVIIEDDATLHPEATNIDALLKSAPSCGLIALCSSMRPLWLSKEGYIITQEIAAALLVETEKIKFSTRGHLSWWALKNPDQVIYASAASPRITIDGSKLGLYPSAIHTHNPLIFNRDYTEMLELATKDVPAPIDTLLKYEASLTKNTNPSPDFMHMLGILFHKAEKSEKARDMFLTAIKEASRQGGVLSTNSELMTNAIAIHKHLQTDLAEAVQSPSKYLKMSAAPLISK